MNPKLQNVMDRLTNRSGIVMLTLCAAVVFAVAIAGVAVGSSRHPNNNMPSSSTGTTKVSGKGINGFSNAVLTVTPAAATEGGQPKTFCVALAKTADQQAKGMMRQTSFGGLDGMVFPFSTDSNSLFYMANVSMPLSVAFFDGTGTYVSSTDMSVCSTDASQCPRYHAGGPYQYALETAQGGLGGMGVGQGSSISIGASC